MNSISILDDRYPVKTVFTDNSDGQSHEGWHRVECRNAAFEEYLRVPLSHVFYAYEEHTGNVLVVTSENVEDLEAMDKDRIPEQIGEYDALATDVPHTMLCICTADCLPLFLYDPRQNVAAIAHCGWRGICNGIVSNTARSMVEHFGTNPRDVVAAFGPSICKGCYEVGGELKDAFARRFLPQEVQRLFASLPSGKFLLDSRNAVALELLREGVRQDKIHDVGICTFESDDYPSFRGEGTYVKAERQMISGIVLT
jgi:YfiH family protein